MKNLNLIIVLASTLLLSACHWQDQEKTWLQNPDQLKTTLAACRSGQQPDAVLCKKAQMVEEVVENYIQLEQKFGGDWMTLRQQYFTLQSDISAEQDPTQRQALVAKQDAVLSSAGQEQFSVQQEFAKLIMQAQNQLAALKLEKLSAKTSDIAELKQKIADTKEKIHIMLLLVGINLPTP